MEKIEWGPNWEEILGGEFVANLQQLGHGNRRAGDGFLSFDLAALNSFGDGHFAFARQQRHHSHFAQIEPHRIVGLLQRAGREIQFQVVVARLFVVGSNRRCLLDQAFVGIRHMNIRRVELLQHVFDVVGRNHILR